MNIQKYWKACLNQDREGMERFFHQDASIKWHNTNERFSAAEFIRANCEYPGEWQGGIEKLIELEDTLITVVHVYSKDREHSLHVTSFFKVLEDRIIALDEYWGNDGEPPQWRLDMKIGEKIR